MPTPPAAFTFSGTAELPDGGTRPCRVRLAKPQAVARDEYQCAVHSNVPALDGLKAIGHSAKQAVQLARRLVASQTAAWGWTLRDARGRVVRIGEPLPVRASRPGRHAAIGMLVSLQRTARGPLLNLREIDLDDDGTPCGPPQSYLSTWLQVSREGLTDRQTAEDVGQMVIQRLVGRARGARRAGRGRPAPRRR